MKVNSLELGGKSPLIVFDDADLETAAELATTSITFSKCSIFGACVVDLTSSFEDSGQICTASSRLYVQAGVADKFKKLLVGRFEKIKLGIPSEHETEIGPQADSKQADAVTSYFDVGDREGRILTGGRRSDTGRNFITPTIFEGVSENGRINAEEVFGPVLVLHTFATAEEAVQLANDIECEYLPNLVVFACSADVRLMRQDGLYASVFSKDVDTALNVARAP
ncbi:hypothetical protein LTR17_024846 [Elasticomyces elasticus]|nr:hypothetical protein LTR17_024846 [Elasticomyces elasticus]